MNQPIDTAFLNLGEFARRFNAIDANPKLLGDYSEVAVLTYPDNELDVKVGYCIDSIDGSVLVESVHTWHSAKEWGPDFMATLTRDQIEDLADQIYPQHHANAREFNEYIRSDR